MKIRTSSRIFFLDFLDEVTKPVRFGRMFGRSKTAVCKSRISASRALRGKDSKGESSYLESTEYPGHWNSRGGTVGA
jgi:hypothetical protein